MTPAAIADHYDRFTDRLQAQLDTTSHAFDSLKDECARDVTFDDVLEQLDALPPTVKAGLMQAVDADRAYFRWKLEDLFVVAIDAAARQRAIAQAAREGVPA
ncbi:hypothetical protein [Burkholderia cenocepacia]|uniref:hypothetical protein n=1 Tax=Burkholderia cenocepacia TaxID=95486 RepID=UPI0022373350|nr:hypothetical protein [Burkholderia cenocepacia]MCW5141083.1 hypothetical protein [Burkholderia cenocepacia]